MQSPPAPTPTGRAGVTASTPPGWAPPVSRRNGGPVRPVPRVRRPALVTVGMLLILVCAAVGGWLYSAATSRVEVLTVVRPVAQGQRIHRADLDVVRVWLDPSVRAVPAREGRSVLGQTAQVPLVPGSLLVRGQYGPGDALAPGDAVVALALKAGQLPGTGLVPGDIVAAVTTPAPAGTGGGPSGGGRSGAAAVLVRAARVAAVTAGVTGDVTVVDLVVPFEDAADLSRAQALGQASLVLVPRPAGS